MIVVDTSFVYALLDAADARHSAAASWYGNVDDDLATSPLVLAEVDHLAGARAGARAQAAFRKDVIDGVYLVEWWPDAAVTVAGIAERYADVAIGLTDASLVAVAARLESVLVATFDERHFRALRPLTGGAAFTLLPADA